MWSHNKVLEIFAEAAKICCEMANKTLNNITKRAIHFIFPTEIALMTQHPDIVIWSVRLKKVFIIELIVAFEENFDWVHQHKLEKYEDLQEQCIRNG